MGLKLKNYLLLFCFFNYVFLQNTLDPGKTIEISDNKDSTFTVEIDSRKTYLSYTSITLNSEGSSNPMMLVGKDLECKERLFVGLQIKDPIQAFLKNVHIDNAKNFYICIKFRPDLEKSEYYTIKVENMDKAYIPFNTQTSYYVNDKNKEMEFVFRGGDITKIKNNRFATFWVKGENIDEKTNMENFERISFDHGYVFTGGVPDADESEQELKVISAKGDYITVGNTLRSGNYLMKDVKVNQNEIMIVSVKKGDNDNEICIPIYAPNLSITFLRGKVYTRKATVAFYQPNQNRDGKGTQITDYADERVESVIDDGIIGQINPIPMNNSDMGYYCLASPITMIISLQLTNGDDETPIIHAPSAAGEIQRHYLLKNKIAIFYGTKPKDEAKEVNLNFKAIKGFPQMYYFDCNDFPRTYKKDDLDRSQPIYPSNMITVYSFYMEDDEKYKNYNPNTQFQPIMAIYCGEGGLQGGFEDFYCEFDTTIFTDDDKINLYKDSTFSQYLLSGEIDHYKIYLNEEDKKLLYIDMMIFSGDADIALNDPNIVANKYYLSNKVFYSVHLEGVKDNSFEFMVAAIQNSFYMIQYQFASSDSFDDTNIIESGVNYIISKNYNSTGDSASIKHIEFKNNKYESLSPYLATFYSPNCEMNFYYEYGVNNSEEITTVTNTAQKLIVYDPEYPDYYSRSFTFYADIVKDDNTDYPKKFCMIYATGFELSNSTSEWNGRSISLSEGVPHRYTYIEQYPLIHYAYHVSDTSKTVVLNFNLIDKTNFDILVFINGNYLREYKIYRNIQKYLVEEDFEGKCTKEEVCTVVVQIKSDAAIEKTLEFIVYQIDNVPHYLEKNVIRQDILHGNKPKYYYFDIGNEEIGDITLNFKRGSGNIYASVVPKVKDDKIVEGADWRGKYKFPNKIGESLQYDNYAKKIMIKASDTEQCSDGCYVLITIVTNVDYYEGYTVETIPFRISITPRIMKINSIYGAPEVRMGVNEFVVGDVFYALPEELRYDYYIVTLPFESDSVVIDWQADSPHMLINVGSRRPSINDRDFELPYIGSDFVQTLTKKEILDKIKDSERPSGLRGLSLTIGIYANVSDSIVNSPYAFKISMPPILSVDEGSLAANIIHVRSDQKVQCITSSSFSDLNICAFAVIFDEFDVSSNLILYPKSQDGSPIKIYGRYMEAEPIEKNDFLVIYNTLVETYTEEYKVNEKYIYQQDIEANQSYVFIVVTENSGVNIEVLSSTYFFHDKMKFYPNPSTPQIYYLKDEEIYLNFITTKGLLINIANVNGIGYFYWNETGDDETSRYYLNGYDDRLSLSSFNLDVQNVFAPLVVKSQTFKENEGFVFVVTYYPQSYVDQLKAERTTEFHYRSVDMPLNYFVPITFEASYTINFNFYNFGLQSNAPVVYENNLFNIWAKVLTTKEMRDVRTDPSYKPTSTNSIKGTFDLTFGTLFVSQEKVEEYYKGKDKSDPELIPNIFMSIEKPDSIRADFSTLGLELNVFSNIESHRITPITEGIYVSGKLLNSKEKYFSYAFKTDKKRPLMMIEYAGISNSIKFVLSKDIEKKTVSDNFKMVNTPEKKNGRNILIVQLNETYISQHEYIFFQIYTDNNNLNDKLDSFVFKYRLGDEVTDFTSFLPKNTTLTVTRKQNNEYLIEFYPIEVEGASYYIKAFYEKGFIEGEIKDTIALSQSPGKYMQINNPNSKGGMLSYPLPVDQNVTFIKVFARFNFLDDKQFYLYEISPISDGTIKPSNTDGGKGDDNTVLYVSIGVGSFLLVVAIVLVVFIFVYNKRNKELVDQVNKISFVESGAKERGEDGNLLLDNSD